MIYTWHYKYLLSEFEQADIFVQNMKGGHYCEGQGLYLLSLDSVKDATITLLGGSRCGCAYSPLFCRDWFDVAVEPTPTFPRLARVNHLSQLLISDSN